MEMKIFSIVSYNKTYIVSMSQLKPIQQITERKHVTAQHLKLKF